MARQDHPPLVKNAAHQIDGEDSRPSAPEDRLFDPATTLKMPHKTFLGGRKPPVSDGLFDPATTLKMPQKAFLGGRKPPASDGLFDPSATLKMPQKAFLASGSRGVEETTETTLSLKLFGKTARQALAEEITDSSNGMSEGEELDEEAPGEPRASWEKVVEYRMPSTPLAVSPAQPEGKKRRGSWLYLLAGSASPRSFFWLSVVVLVALLLGGAFGVVLSFGREASKSSSNLPTLQAGPQRIALGGIVTLRGTRFAPNGLIELSRDGQIILVDTGGKSSIQADARGSFSDTIIVDPLWLSGTHILYATDVHTHQQVSTSIIVTGQSALQGPPHLLLSSAILNLGTGDEATNSSQLLALSNAGGGSVVWQASPSQPWLQITPDKGAVASGKHMSTMVAVDRSMLSPGAYAATVIFTSNTEQVTLTVNMTVTPLQLQHEDALLLSQVALNFTTTTGSSDAHNQVLTIRNPGIQPLAWNASVNFQNAFGWLTVTPSSGSIKPGAQQQLVVSLSNENLSPGVYQGTILFSRQNAQAGQDHSQSVYVSLTVAPLCSLATAPASLSFTSLRGHASPSSQALSVEAAEGCGMSLFWRSVSTTTNTSWLDLDAISGTTPSHVKVSVNPAGLAAGVYRGAITFTASAGSQIVPVTLTVNPLPCSITVPAMVDLEGTIGQAGAISQTAAVGTTGNCAHVLRWTSSFSVITPASGTWLSTPRSGTFTVPATGSVSIHASLAGLNAGVYSGTVTISAVDTVTGQSAGSAQISVMLTALAQCVISTPSNSSLTFSADADSVPLVTTQSFTLDVSGNCPGGVTLSASVDASGTGWLTVSPTTAQVASGATETFSVTVATDALLAGNYQSTITLLATGGGSNLAGSSQSVTVSLGIQASVVTPTPTPVLIPTPTDTPTPIPTPTDTPVPTPTDTPVPTDTPDAITTPDTTPVTPTPDDADSGSQG